MQIEREKEREREREREREHETQRQRKTVTQTEILLTIKSDRPEPGCRQNVARIDDAVQEPRDLAQPRRRCWRKKKYDRERYWERR